MASKRRVGGYSQNLDPENEEVNIDDIKKNGKKFLQAISSKNVVSDKAMEEAGLMALLSYRTRLWQLTIKEAVGMCRYEWMRRALEEFLRVMAEEVDALSIAVSDTGDCHQIRPLKSCVTVQLLLGCFIHAYD